MIDFVCCTAWGIFFKLIEPCFYENSLFLRKVKIKWIIKIWYLSMFLSSFYQVPTLRHVQPIFWLPHEFSIFSTELYASLMVYWNFYVTNIATDSLSSIYSIRRLDTKNITAWNALWRRRKADEALVDTAKSLEMRKQTVNVPVK